MRDSRVPDVDRRVWVATPSLPHLQLAQAFLASILARNMQPPNLMECEPPMGPQIQAPRETAMLCRWDGRGAPRMRRTQ